MLSHSCFFGALLVYYIPKAFGKKSPTIVKLHILLGCLAVLGMILETIQKIGQDSFLKYIGFSIVMIAIALTGFLYERKGKTFKWWHIGAMASFFIYLAGIIIF